MKALRVVCVTILVLGIAVAGYALEKRNAKITSLNGPTEVKRAGQAVWSPASNGMVLGEGDALKTAEGSWALVNIDNGKIAMVELKGGSQMSIAELAGDPKSDTSKTLLDLAIGEVLIKAQKVHGESSKFEVKTPTSIVGVRGTTFNVKVEAVKE